MSTMDYANTKFNYNLLQLIGGSSSGCNWPGRESQALAGIITKQSQQNSFTDARM
ncbi:hypothetical protein e1116g03.tmp0065 [Eimeria tenella]|uniref:Uncharacterized protein n=1 Tax=Eimeria tenella TaxID=5802 RepID=C8TE39_EIMTE|nr:hypothetical protein e1116g03.tmp0065 [Eimeria tenella]